MFIYREIHPDFTTLYQFLSGELSMPCLNPKSGLVRVFNGLPTEAKLDVYIDEILLAKELSYKEFSRAIVSSALKNNNVKVYISSELDRPIIDTQIQIPSGGGGTLAVVGSLENPSILIVEGDYKQPFYPDKSVIRYANLTDEDLTINVVRSNNIISSETVKSNEYNRYKTINPQTYQFQFVLADSLGTNVISAAIHELKPTRIYTFYLVGSLDPTSNYQLELVISVDMSTVIKQCPTNMKRF